MDVYFACNEIGKAILSRYIRPEDIEEHVDLIRYDGPEEVSANEIFQQIYQQISPERWIQLAKLEYINVKLCTECLIPCDSDRCEDCREPGTTETKPIIDKGKGSMYPKPDPELEDILTQTENMIASL